MFSIALSLALSAAAPAQEQPAATPPVTEQKAKPEKPKRICRATKMTGSSIGRRVCKTEAQWSAIDGTQDLEVVNQGFKANIGNGAVN